MEECGIQLDSRASVTCLGVAMLGCIVLGSRQGLAKAAKLAAHSMGGGGVAWWQPRRSRLERRRGQFHPQTNI
jgi:hypothetical protein